jgi:hypothetical protein
MGGQKKSKATGVWPTVKPFVNGGASGMLTRSLQNKVKKKEKNNILMKNKVKEEIEK